MRKCIEYLVVSVNVVALDRKKNKGLSVSLLTCFNFVSLPEFPYAKCKLRSAELRCYSKVWNMMYWTVLRNHLLDMTLAEEVDSLGMK